MAVEFADSWMELVLLCNVQTMDLQEWGVEGMRMPAVTCGADCV